MRYQTKKQEYSNGISEKLSYRQRIFAISENEIQGRIDYFKNEYKYDPTLKSKQKSFIKQMIDTNQYLCYQCRTLIKPHDIILPRRNLQAYHIRCAIRLGIVPAPTGLDFYLMVNDMGI